MTFVLYEKIQSSSSEGGNVLNVRKLCDFRVKTDICPRRIKLESNQETHKYKLACISDNVGYVNKKLFLVHYTIIL